MFFEFFWFEQPLLRYLLKTVLHCKGSGIWVDAITQVISKKNNVILYKYTQYALLSENTFAWYREYLVDCMENIGKDQQISILSRNCLKTIRTIRTCIQKVPICSAIYRHLLIFTVLHTSLMPFFHIQKVRFYPRTDIFTQALLVMLVTSITSGKELLLEQINGHLAPYNIRVRHGGDKIPLAGIPTYFLFKERGFRRDTTWKSKCLFSEYFILRKYFFMWKVKDIYGASWQLRIKSSLPSSSGTSQFVESTWFRIDKRSLSSFGLAHSGFSSSSFPGQSFFPSHLQFHLYIHPQCVSRTALIKKWEISTIYYKMYKIYQRQMERHSSVPLQLTPFTHISTSPENHI